MLENSLKSMLMEAVLWQTTGNYRSIPSLAPVLRDHIGDWVNDISF
jgi:hypothetical protein